MPTAVNVVAGVKPSRSVLLSIFNEKLPVPSVIVTKASTDCGVSGIVPLTIETFAIETNWPSNDSGLLVMAAIVVATGGGAGPLETTATPYGDVVFSTDSMMSNRRRPPLKPTRPRASPGCPGVVARNGVGVVVVR